MDHGHFARHRSFAGGLVVTAPKTLFPQDLDRPGPLTFKALTVNLCAQLCIQIIMKTAGEIEMANCVSQQDEVSSLCFGSMRRPTNPIGKQK